MRYGLVASAVSFFLVLTSANAQSLIECKVLRKGLPEVFTSSYFYRLNESKKELIDASEVADQYKSRYKTLKWTDTTVLVESYSGAFLPDTDQEVKRFTHTSINRLNGEFLSWEKYKDKKGQVLSDQEIESFAQENGFDKGMFRVEVGVYRTGKCAVAMKKF